MSRDDDPTAGDERAINLPPWTLRLIVLLLAIHAGRLLLPSVDDDPAGAWAGLRDAIQAGLDDPVVAERVADCGPPGRLSFAAAVDLTCTPDVLIHTWDLARAAGLDEVLDPDEVHAMVSGFESLPPEVDDAMRSSGHYGPKVAVPADADEQSRLLAFMGRRA